MNAKTTLMNFSLVLCAGWAVVPTGCDSVDPLSTESGSSSDATAGVLRVRAITDSLATATLDVPSAQQAPDDVDVNLTPSEYAIAFKRIVIKQFDEKTNTTLAEVEVFTADTIDDALVVDLTDSAASDILSSEDLTAGTYNKVDIEVFYLDMTVATTYPGSESHDIPYRMVFEDMGVLEQRDFLLYFEPSWMASGSALAGLVTEAGWYWMQMMDPDNVTPVEGAVAHPMYNVLDLFADEAFWSSEHKVLEGGVISPALEYDPKTGGVLTIQFDVTGKFNFKDYHDETEAADGLWEIRKDAGIHPFPPDFTCVPQLSGSSGLGS